jgi:hypothetical protein
LANTNVFFANKTMDTGRSFVSWTSDFEK